MSTSGPQEQGENTSTTPQFISALVMGAIVLTALTALFFVFFTKFKSVYQSRQKLVTDGKHPGELPDSFIGFWRTIIFAPDELVLEQNGLDSYFFVRFLKIFGVYLLIPYFLLTFIILVPVSAASPNAGLDGLNKLTYGNVAQDQPNRRIAHLLVGLVLIGWTLYVLYCEYVHLYDMRQRWLQGNARDKPLKSRTMMLVNVPEEYQSETALSELAAQSGSSGPVRVWIAKNAKSLQDVYDDRNAEVARLEGGEAKLFGKITKNVKKNKTPGDIAAKDKKTDQKVAPRLSEDVNNEDQSAYGMQPIPSDSDRFEARPAQDVEPLISRYLNEKEKSKMTWKQGFLGLIGTKMDRYSSPKYIKEKNDELENLRQDAADLPNGNVAWVTFATQHDAHTFARIVNRGKGRKLITTSVEVVPEDIIWKNTVVSMYQRKIGSLVSWAITIFLIIIWGALVAFVGAVSNVDTLCTKASWLAWVCEIPEAGLGIIKGILPAALLAALFAVLPIFLRFCLDKQGIVRGSELELNLFKRFWLFQIIHGFLIVTVASGLMNALPKIFGGGAGQAPTLLAENLPGASIFFLTFILTSYFSGAAKTYSRATPVVMSLLKPILGGKTPRKWWATEHKMDSFTLGTLWPPMCLVVVLVIVYSLIQPVITVVGLVCLALLYVANKYIFGWCADQKEETDTGGLYYPKVLNTVFVGLYIQELCMCGLFFLTSNPDGGRTKAGIAGGALMIVAIIVTAAFHVFCRYRFNKNTLTYISSSIAGGSSAAAANANPSAPDAKLTLAPTATATTGDGYDDLENAEAISHENAYTHPALWRKQPLVWLAKDEYGVSDAEVARIRQEQRIDVSNDYARLDGNAKLHVEYFAPDKLTEPEI